MAGSLYELLGVSPKASDAEIRAAYRRLAKRYHPDFNRGDPGAEARFKRITAAYEILGDPEKRRRYDLGEIDEEGRERVRAEGFWRAGRGRTGFAFQGGVFGGFEELIQEILAGGGRRSGHSPFGRDRGRRPAERRLALEVAFATAARGGRVPLTLPSGRRLEVTVPPGTESGRLLRLRGQGEAGEDVLVEVRVRPDPRFSRQGWDVVVDQPVPLQVAVLGGRLRVPTLDGEVLVTVPPGSSSGRMLRLRGKGIDDPAGRRGDQLVRLLVMLPDDPELTSLLEEWARRRERAPAD